MHGETFPWDDLFRHKFCGLPATAHLNYTLPFTSEELKHRNAPETVAFTARRCPSSSSLSSSSTSSVSSFCGLVLSFSQREKVLFLFRCRNVENKVKICWKFTLLKVLFQGFSVKNPFKRQISTMPIPYISQIWLQKDHFS